MWLKISGIILRNKIVVLIVLAIITLVMGYYAVRVEMSYEHAPLLPRKDQAFKDYKYFVDIFGEEGNLIILGVQDSLFFQFDRFNRWKLFNEKLSEVDGVDGILSVSNAYNLEKDSELRKFNITEIFPDSIQSQESLNKHVEVFRNLPLYRSLVYNLDTEAYLLAITVNKDKMHSKEREKVVKDIIKVAERFEKEQHIKLHYSGLPYIRVINSIQIKKEIYLFSLLALIICILVLFLFFRSFKAVFFPVMIVLTGVIWAMGMLSFFGYKITLLSGMIAPLLIVIGIPNSIYMLNKFHHEYIQHGNKIKALQRVIIKIGNATFLTNLTTASGFATFIIVKSEILKQFGIVASLSIMGLFFLSLTLIPIIFSFIDPPSTRHVKHLNNKFVGGIIDRLIYISEYHRNLVYITAVVILAAGIYGVTLIKSSGYMVDDIRESDPIYTDLKFFESNFDGLMPLEILVDTKKAGGVMNLSTLKKIDQLEQRLSSYPELSPSLSLINLVKFSRQAFYNGNENYYTLPNSREQGFIMQYMSIKEEENNLLSTFIDTTKQMARISFRMHDVGTKRMEEIYDDINHDVDSIFANVDFDILVTGSSVTSFKGTQYLLRNLFSSLGLAIFLIASFMAIMFSWGPMVLLSLIPNLLPLVFTAALMGFAGIPIKASTILVFSIAFGISVDSTIHFLAKYRLELRANGKVIRQSVVMAMKETGVSMLYTVVVLFFGFGIFALSGFGGTVAMGVLVSLTLLVAVISNLILLPSLLSSLDKIHTMRFFKEPLLYVFNEEEDIELEELRIKTDNYE